MLSTVIGTKILLYAKNAKKKIKKNPVMPGVIVPLFKL
jgi:hypothetical protein